jgi:hypothetical protein
LTLAIPNRDGELLEALDQQPPETLADALAAIRERQHQLDEIERAFADELRRRLKILDRKLATFGDWEVERTVRRSSEWDADDLERTMGELVAEGVVKAGEIADVITREPVVSRSKAAALAKRLDGTASTRVKAACTWKEKPGPLTVKRSVQLAPALPVHDLTPEELFA